MPLGIRPTVDFVFKLLFGSSENVDLLIHLLNSVLQPNSPIEEVEILNPFNEKSFADDKLSVVDVKARDAAGAWYVIEVQTTIPAGLRNRLVYYTSGLYYGQMREGHAYGELRPAISICFLTEPLFPEVAASNLCFSLNDSEHGVSLGDQLQIHLVELPKYNVSEEELAGAAALERWVFFMAGAANYEASDMRRLLPGAVYQKATGVLEMITRSPELRLIYDDRAKEEKDKFSFVKDAKAEAKAEGRAEGKLVGRIQLLQQLLDVADPDEAALLAMNELELKQVAIDLEKRFEKLG